MAQPRILEVRKNILEKNDRLAHMLRTSFAQHVVLAVNFVSGPGAGKTELLRRTLVELGKTQRCAAVTGDLATANDADRLAQSGAPAKQILTGTMCHLEADMVADAIAEWTWPIWTTCSSRTSATWSAPATSTWAKTCACCCSPPPKAKTSR